ncbi:TPA: TatD family deoxyribonuclease [Candidatus Poribacteria bacterium]|nr:TatD family deoxyribonuclease [Candidatus Poribacteria bacterium]HEX30871.1 TatD family deoxyribonuclease [Candidatus Poribacteria bacterium]
MSGALVDTHCHLQLEDYRDDLHEVLKRAREANVVRMIAVGFNLRTSRLAVELASRFEQIYATVGVHPHDAKEFNERTIDELRKLARREKVVAIGEIGLDYYRNLSPKGKQRYAFERQLELAGELGLPVVIHDRDAHEDVAITLERYINVFKVNISGVMHCFSGDWELAKRCLDVGFYISIAGPVTYPNSADLRQVASKVPIDRLLVETDSPWLAPQHRRGRRNEPAYVKFVARKVAELRRMPFGKLADITTQNAVKLFGIQI